MAKTKKKTSSDAVNAKKVKKPKEMNPFEIHVNKEKMRVLGKKSKNDKGLPGISRAKALNKRKHTLLEEYKIQHKSNLLSDKRIGEKNNQMSFDDKAVARFTAERIKAHKKKSIFNLADDEVLTHRGQVLTEIEKFDDPKSDDDGEEEETGKLDNDFTEKAHFGGGILQDTGNEGFKSHKDLIDKLILESKKRKAEKQRLKEATVEMTEKLDSEWKDLIPLMKPKNKDNEEKKPEADNYDKMMRQLIFEARGQPTDRLKTEEEIAKEEKDKLEKLEQERLKRMRGEEDGSTAKNKQVKHRSADDLEDNFAYDSDPEITISYDHEGNPNFETKNTEEEAEQEEDDKNSCNEDQEEEEDEESEEEDEEDNLSDLKASSSEGEDEEEEQAAEKGDKEEEEEEQAAEEGDEEEEEELENEKMDVDVDKNKRELQEEEERKKEKARNELPYTFAVPNSYEDFYKLLENHNCFNQSVIVERMIKCNHPSLGDANREKLNLVFVYLLQFLNDLSADVKTCFESFKQLVNHLFDLAHLISKSAHDSLLEIIKEKHEEFKKHHKKQPDLGTLIFFKLVSVLFTTSDFRHQVVTPALIFMEQILSLCLTKNKAQIAYGLFVTTLILEYTALSKRYSPASINYLKKILKYAIPITNDVNNKKMNKKPNGGFLVLENSNDGNNDLKAKLTSQDLCEKTCDDEFKIRALHVAIKLLEEFNRNLEYLPSSCEIFEEVHKLLIQIPAEKYPKNLQSDLKTLINNLVECKKRKQLIYLVEEKRKPKALRLYEPNVEKVFDYKKHKVQSKEKAELSKLAHKLKQEKKGALREIRRDRAFLGKVKLKQRIQSDLERRQKVNKIFAEANMQQSELNAMDRKKKRK